MKVLVDTSVWSLAFRRRAKNLSESQKRLVRELSDLIAAGRTLLIGVIRQEVLSGIREDEAFERLRDRLRWFPDEVLDIEDYEVAARVANRCRAAGLAGSPIDFLICAVAMRRSVPVFTLDRDFGRYATLLSINLHDAAKNS